MDNNKENQQLDCEIVRDLLTLYHDDVVSEKTKAAIKEHFNYCPDCRKEYEELSADLPIEAGEPSTKNQFINMMRRQKRKRLLLSSMAVVVACALLIAAYFGQMQLLIANVPDDEITVHRVYRYETDEGYKFFILYSIPPYDYTRGDVSVEQGENGNTLVINIKKPLITRKNTEWGTYDQTWLYRCGYVTGDEGIIYEDYSAVEFGGEIVWSEAANSKDEIPAYVYAYEEFSDSTSSNMSSWIFSSENEYVGVGYSDGRVVLWDFDGTVLSDSYRSSVPSEG